MSNSIAFVDHGTEHYPRLCTEGNISLTHMDSLAENNSTPSGAPAQSQMASLPTEVMFSVFETFTSSSLDANHVAPEQLLCQVDRRWRAIALRTPSLWTNIHIIYPHSFHLNRADMYLHRSGTLPLSLHVDFRQSGFIWDRVVQIVTQHIRRWHHLGFCFAGKESFEAVMSVLSTAFVPILHSCHLSAPENEDPENDFKTNIFTSGAPSLVSFGVRGLALHRWRPPLRMLTDLRIHEPSRGLDITFDSFASMLNDMVSLQYLVMEGDLIDEWTPHVRISLPCLLDLQLRGHRLTEFPHLLAALRAPLLLSLMLENIEDSEIDFMWSEIEPSPFPSLRYLTVITFAQSDISVEVWTHFPDLFPTIKQFVLLHHSLHMFLEAFSEVSAADELPWPDLTTLTLIKRQNPLSSTLIEVSLSKLLFNRAEQCCPIQTLQLSESIFSQLGERLQQSHPDLQIDISTPLPEFGEEYVAVKWPFDQYGEEYNG